MSSRGAMRLIRGEPVIAGFTSAPGNLPIADQETRLNGGGDSPLRTALWTTIPANRENSREFDGNDSQAKCGTAAFIAVFA